MFSIVYATGVADDLRRMRGRDRAFVLDRIEAALVDQPTTMTRNRKLLVGIRPPWDQELPVWELRSASTVCSMMSRRSSGWLPSRRFATNHLT